MHINVIPELVAFAQATYIVRLRGTALLSEQARGWVKQAGRWRTAGIRPGHDIEMGVRQADPEIGFETPFELSLKWAEDRPGRGPVLWGGRYLVRETPEGPLLEECSGAGEWIPHLPGGNECQEHVMTGGRLQSASEP